jgi:hypothetical protein
MYLRITEMDIGIERNTHTHTHIGREREREIGI